MSYPLYLITYDRGLHPLTNQVRPRHWLIFIQTRSDGPSNVGIVHQLSGMPGGFHYPGPEETDPNDAPSKKTELEIGQVPVDKLDRVRELLQANWVDKSEISGWNCQNWTLEGIGKLRAEGFVEEVYTDEVIRSWLREK